MPVTAVSLPASALMLPGAAGRADPLAHLRATAVAALIDAVGRAGRCLVVARGSATRFADLLPDLGQAGGPWVDVSTARSAETKAVPTSDARAGLQASVLLTLLDTVAPVLPRRVLEIADDATGDELSAVLVRGDVVLVGDDAGRGAVRACAGRALGPGRRVASVRVADEELTVKVWGTP
ncbi:hypothetical protein [Paraoerskovia marina]|uniref:hypothetical protein n=1 Tax=Paraoerskovia marina TaxID=545619 RepID=UPI000492B6FA|nr:hypothetical protein [Paraoerskovia marina]